MEVNVMLPIESNMYAITVGRQMEITDTLPADPQRNILAGFRGHLRRDSRQAYDQLAADLRPEGITPLFRKEQGQATVLLLDGVVNPRPSNPWVNLGLFALTLVSVLMVGAINNYSGPPAASFSELLAGVFSHLSAGIPFAASLLAILLAHEFGHYLAARYHRTAVTLPYFIPFPLSLFGTMGAFIQLKEPPKNRQTLLDIGLAGPLAGLVVAIPVLLYGLSLSTIDRLDALQGFSLEGNSLLYLLSKFLVFGRLLPAPETYGNVSPLLYWMRYFFTGQPLPIGGMDVQLHPIAWAGWAGLLVTALNLIPAGQLDGGHLLYVLTGRRARLLLPFILVSLILLGFVWNGWWLWAFLILLLGRAHAEPLDQITPLDPGRKAMAVVGLLVFILVFTPVPLVLM